MKKILLLVALVCMGYFANAQLYIGGGLGFDFTKTKPDQGDDNEKTTAFNINPEIGYSLNDKMDVGITLGFFSRKATTTVSNVESELKNTGWGVAPYFRYSFVEFGKFRVLGRAEVYVAGGKTKTKPVVTETKFTEFGIEITPMLMYDISDRISLFTELNFLSLGFSHNKIKDGDSETNFGLDIDADNVLNVGAITVGFSYKF